MVSFRLSYEEYELYRQACAAVDVHSLSELARIAMQQFIRGHNGTMPVDDQLRDLRERVQTLSHEVERIAQRVDCHDVAPRIRAANGSSL
jgi:hypothetical protein